MDKHKTIPKISPEDFLSSPNYKNTIQMQMRDHMNNFTEMNLDIIKKLSTPEERLKFITEKMDSMNSELEEQTDTMRKIQYENMKLNAQIEVLNKTIDSDKEKLDKLQENNVELKAINISLEKSNRHYWRNTLLISFGVAISSFIIGLFSTEVRALLLQLLTI